MTELDDELQSLRQAAFDTPMKMQDVATPFWAGTDGKFAIGDIPADELMRISEVAKTDKASYVAILICRALVSRRTGKPVFGRFKEDGSFVPTDADAIKAQGSVCMALIGPINEFFGFDTKAALEAAKNG
jgi:hypothetical protein